jgi:hypothetical protein
MLAMGMALGPRKISLFFQREKMASSFAGRSVRTHCRFCLWPDFVVHHVVGVSAPEFSQRSRPGEKEKEVLRMSAKVVTRKHKEARMSLT